MKYNYQLILDWYDNSESLEFLFFWGHQPPQNKQIGNSCLSQWYQAGFTVDQVYFPTAEHWMMAEKAKLFRDQESLLKILDSQSPGKAKKLGREVKNFDISIWNDHKYDIVKVGNWYKFQQNPLLTNYLISTKDLILVEASPYDKIWGIGLAKDNEGITNPHNWKGKNLLGFALMEVRDSLKN